MNDSFEKLLNLSKRTGDTLIVFDKESGEHQVVMNIEKYEELHTSSNPAVGTLSEEQLIDRLNKDISLWKDSQTAEMDEDLSFMTEKAKAEVAAVEAPEVEFESVVELQEDSEDWHSAADILDSIHPEFESEIIPEMEALSLEEDEIKLDLEAEAPQALKYDPVMQEPAAIPMVEQNEDLKESTDLFQEEPLEDEPIFFEEPIN
jgi:hypothetical protein